MGSKVLVVDDEKLIVKGIKFSLEQDGMEVDTCFDGESALEKLKEKEYDMVLLDLMLPGMDGLDGADDYITKPFNILEVKARIKAILRRNAKYSQNEYLRILENGDLKLELDGRRLYVCGEEVNLTAKEFDLLELMVGNPNKVFSREELLNTVWGYEYPGDVRTVDVHIRRLREKIEPNPGEPRYVHTKWGVGYFFKG